MAKSRSVRSACAFVALAASSGNVLTAYSSTLVSTKRMAVVEFVPAQAIGGGEAAALAAHGRAHGFFLLQQAVEVRCLAGITTLRQRKHGSDRRLEIPGGIGLHRGKRFFDFQSQMIHG